MIMNNYFLKNIMTCYCNTLFTKHHFFLPYKRKRQSVSYNQYELWEACFTLFQINFFSFCNFLINGSNYITHFLYDDEPSKKND